MTKDYLKRGSALGHLSAYTFTHFLTKFVSFAALPLFVNFLTEGDIGLLSIFNNSIVFLTPILSMGILYSISTDYFKYERSEFAKRLSSILILPFIFCLLSILLLSSFFGILQENFKFHPAFIWLIPCCTFLNIFFEAYLILCRNENNVKLFSITCVAKSFLEIGIAILLIFFVAKNWMSRATGLLFSGLFIFFSFAYYMYKRQLYKPVLHWKVIKAELRFAAPAILFQTAIFCLGTSDKFFVMNFFNEEKTGIYSIASVFASVLFIFCLAFLQFIQPRLYRSYSEGKKWAQVKNICYKYIYAMIALAVALAVVTPFLYRWILKPSYYEGVTYFFILLFSNLVWTVTNLFVSLILFHKDQKHMVVFACVVIPLSLLSYHVAIKNWGLIGISIAAVMVNLTVLSVVMIQNWQKKFFTQD